MKDCTGHYSFEHWCIVTGKRDLQAYYADRVYCLRQDWAKANQYPRWEHRSELWRCELMLESFAEAQARG